MNYSTLYNIIDYSIVIVYGLTFAYLFIRAIEFIDLKTRLEDYDEPLGFYEVAVPSIPSISSIETVKDLIAQEPSPVVSDDLSSLHISKLRSMADVPANSKLTKKELLAILM
jgi:hypothetical protein